MASLVNTRPRPKSRAEKRNIKTRQRRRTRQRLAPDPSLARQASLAKTMIKAAHADVALQTVLLPSRRYIGDGFPAFHASHCRRSFNAAGVPFQSPWLASGDEDPGGQPWVSRPTFRERCRRSIPSGGISFLIGGRLTTCSSSGNGTSSAPPCRRSAPGDSSARPDSPADFSQHPGRRDGRGFRSVPGSRSWR